MGSGFPAKGRDYSVYVLMDENEKTRYVGITNNPKNRLNQHLYG
jgi:predicted GIY-YIG superfamily endonuclease